MCIDSITWDFQNSSDSPINDEPCYEEQEQEMFPEEQEPFDLFETLGNILKP